MIIQKATQVTFEAFGKEHIVFTESLDMNFIEQTISGICPTAFVSNVCTTVIDKSTFLLSNLENVVMWNKALQERIDETHK